MLNRYLTRPDLLSKKVVKKTDAQRNTDRPRGHGEATMVFEVGNGGGLGQFHSSEGRKTWMG